MAAVTAQDADALAAYEAMADAYAADEGNAYNALYERPAMLSLLGDVDRLRVLDAGCGTGALAAELVARGATVVGRDLSPRMVARARARGLERATFAVADLAEPLSDLEAGTFDRVAASLVLHYLHRLEGAPARARARAGARWTDRHLHDHPEMVAREWRTAIPRRCSCSTTAGARVTRVVRRAGSGADRSRRCCRPSTPPGWRSSGWSSRSRCRPAARPIRSRGRG